MNEYIVNVPLSFTATIIVEAYNEDQAKNIADWAVHLMKTEDRIKAFDLLEMLELHGNGGVVGEPICEISHQEADEIFAANERALS